MLLAPRCCWWHKTTTPLHNNNHCPPPALPLLSLVPTGDVPPSKPDPEGGIGVVVAVVPPFLSSRPNPPHTALNHPATLAQAIAPPATKASAAARCCNVALHPRRGAVPPLADDTMLSLWRSSLPCGQISPNAMLILLPRSMHCHAASLPWCHAPPGGWHVAVITALLSPHSLNPPPLPPCTTATMAWGQWSDGDGLCRGLSFLPRRRAGEEGAQLLVMSFRCGDVFEYSYFIVRVLSLYF